MNRFFVHYYGYMTLYLFFMGSIFFNINTLYANKAIEKPWITIIIHGAMKPRLSLSDISHVFHDRLTEGRYARSARALRKNKMVTENQAAQDIGLHGVDINLQCKGCASAAFVGIYEKINKTTVNQSTNNRYYTFGWSGIYSNSEREAASVKLYHALQEELSKLKKQGIFPRIRIVGYSHGGLIALLLARECLYRVPAIPFCIDELMLWGTPIHRDSDYLITSPLFKQIYHFYSMGDYVQKLDLISSPSHTSHRRFAPRCGFALPDNLTQVRMRVEREYPKRILDPGHSELWFFGWSFSRYRKKFPLYPLPVASLTPYLVNVINTHCAQMRDITITLQPYNAQAIIASHSGKCSQRQCSLHKTVSFLDINDIHAIKSIALNNQPVNYSKERFSHLLNQLVIHASGEPDEQICAIS